MPGEVPEKIFRRHTARRKIIFVRADIAGNLSRLVYFFHVKLHERGVGRGANRGGNVCRLALEFEDGGRGNFNIVRLRDNRRLEIACSIANRNCGVDDFFVAVHVALPVLSRFSIDVRHGSRARFS